MRIELPVTLTPISIWKQNEKKWMDARPLASAKRYTDNERRQAMKEWGTPEAGQEYILRSLREAPTRKFPGTGRNVRSRYTSRKMRRRIETESRRVEFPAVVKADFDGFTHELCCQPVQVGIPRIIRQTSRHGKVTEYAHDVPYTPDLLRLTDYGPFVEEWKTEHELLKLAKKEEAYMDALVIPHRNLKEVVDEVRPRMTAGVGLSITMVVGPSGVGKSSLGRKQLEVLLSHYAIQIQEDPSIIPAIMVEVDPADKDSEINVTLLYSRFSNALLAPTVLDGFNIPRTTEDAANAAKGSRVLFEAAVKGRNLQHLILDEAIHFLHSSTGPLHYGDLLKSLSNRSGFNLLLLGAYGCEELIHASDQLARRISVVHYSRYKPCDLDFKEYATFIKSVSAAMPYYFEVDVEKSLEYMFEGTFGLPGTTVDVLREAAATCAQEKNPRWSDSILRKSMPSRKAQLIFAKKTIQGEDRIEPYLRTECAIEYATEKSIREELKRESDERKDLNGQRTR